MFMFKKSTISPAGKHAEQKYENNYMEIFQKPLIILLNLQNSTGLLSMAAKREG